MDPYFLPPVFVSLVGVTIENVVPFAILGRQITSRCPTYDPVDGFDKKLGFLLVSYLQRDFGLGTLQTAFSMR